MGVSKEQMDEMLATLAQDPERKAQVIETLSRTMPPPTAEAAQGANVPDGQGGVVSNNPRPMPPKTPEEVADNKSRWETFLDEISDPRSNTSALMQTGLALMQPVQPGQTEQGHIAGALAGGLQQLRGNRIQAEELDRRAQEAADVSALRGAQTGRTEATTETLDRRRESLDFEDEFTKAQTRFIEAKTRILGQDAKKGRAPSAAEIGAAQDELLDIAWFNAHPGKFVDLADAKVDRFKFETTKGRPALIGAMESLLENASVLRKDRILPVLELVKQETTAAEERPKSARQVSKDRLDALSPEDWKAVAADPEKRKRLEQAFGAAEIANRLRTVGLE